jgi:hypothetical protein
MQELDTFLQEYPQNISNIEWLSTSLLQLSHLLYDINNKLSQAENDELRSIITYMDQARDGKRMAVSEAEKRAMADTANSRHTHENYKQSLLVMIDSINRRIEVLTLDKIRGSNEQLYN